MAVPREDEMLFQQVVAGLFDEEGFFPGDFATDEALEALQLHVALEDAAPNGGRRAGRHIEEPPEAWNPYMAMTRTANAAWAAVVKPFVAPRVPNHESAQTLSDRQYAMEVAAAEQHVQLDMEFAKALQRLEDAGVDLSDTSMEARDAVLGSGTTQSTMVSDSFIMPSWYY